mgnify:FL=1
MRKLRNFMSLLISFLVVVATPVQAATNENTIQINTDLLLIVLLISVTVNILLIKVFVAIRYNADKTSKTSTQTSLENSDLKASINQLTRQVQSLQCWKKNVKRAVPNIDELISNEIAKENAKSFDYALSKVLKAKSSTENYDTFKTAIENYNNLSENVKKHVSTDIALIEEKLEIAKKCYIHSATQYLTRAGHYHPIGSEHSKWEKAFSYYNNLPTEVHAELDRALINEFLSMYQLATADYNYSKVNLSISNN